MPMCNVTKENKKSNNGCIFHNTFVFTYPSFCAALLTFSTSTIVKRRGKEKWCIRYVFLCSEVSDHFQTYFKAAWIVYINIYDKFHILSIQMVVSSIIVHLAIHRLFILDETFLIWWFGILIDFEILLLFDFCNFRYYTYFQIQCEVLSRYINICNEVRTHIRLVLDFDCMKISLSAWNM